MADTDVLASIYLHLASDIPEQLAAAKGEVAAFNGWMDSLNGKSAVAPARISLGADAVDAEAARIAASVSALEASLSSTAIEAADKEVAAAIKSADGRIAASQRAVVAIARDYDSESRAAAAAAAREAASAEKASATEVAAQERATASMLKEYDRRSAGAQAAAEKQAALLTKVVTGGTLLGAGILAGAADEAVRFQTEMQKVQGNTGATTVQLALMKKEVLELGDEGPAALDDIAAGFRHVNDLGYRGADGITVMTEAWKGAIATGGKVEDVGNALATILGNQHAPAVVAAHDIDVIVTAAQQGNLTIPDFSNNFQKIGTIAGSVHQPLEQVAAAFSAVSRATADPAIAQTYMQGMLAHIIAPTKAAITIMDELKKTTGIDLPAAFTAFANGQITLHDLLLKTKEATAGNTEEIFKLFGGLRGGQAGLILLNNHWEDYNSILGKTLTANKNVNTSFEDMQKTSGAQLQTLENKVKELAISLGTDLLPAINGVVNDIAPLVDGLRNLNDQTGGGVSEVIKLGVEWGGAVFVLGKLTPAVLAAKDAMYGLAAGEIAVEAASPIGWLVALGVGTVALAEETQHLAFTHTGERTELDKLIDRYAQGKITLHELETETHDHSATLEEVAKRARQAAIDAGIYTGKLDEQRKAFKSLNSEMQYGLGLAQGIDKAYPKTFNSLGLGMPTGGAGASNSPHITTLEADIKSVDGQITKWAEKVYTDGQKFGEHSSEVEADRAKLSDLKAKSVELHKEWDDLTTTTKQLKTAGLDPFQAGFQHARDVLASATDAIAEDNRKGIPVSAELRQKFDEASASVKRYQAAQDAADGTAAARAAAKDKADHAAWARWENHQDALEAAADRAAKAILKMAAAAESKPGGEGAEASARAGMFSQIGKPAGSGGLDPISLIEQQINNLNPSNYVNEAAYEKAVQGLFTKLDHAITSYGSKTESAFNKAAKDWESNPNNVGSDAWFKKKKAAYDKWLNDPNTGASPLLQTNPLARPPVISPTQYAAGGVGGGLGGVLGSIGSTIRLAQQPAPDAITNFAGLQKGFLDGTVMLDTFIKAGKGATDETDRNTRMMIAAEQGWGDSSKALADMTPLYLKGQYSLGVFTRATIDAANQIDDNTKKMIPVEQGSGNEVEAAAQSKDLYLRGKESLDQYVHDQGLADVATKLVTQRTYEAAKSLGDIPGAAAAAKQGYLDGTVSFADAVAAIKKDNDATAASTQKSWDLSFAAGSAADKTNMLVQAFGGLVSRASTIAGAQSGVDNADLQVIAARSAVAVGLLQAQVTATNDLGSIISARAAVQTAIGNGTLAAINDSIPILNDMYQISLATSPQALKVAQDQLQIDRLTAQMDAVQAAWQVRIASDQARQAMDKLQVDSANASAHQAVLMLQLAAADDAKKIALDNQVISIDQLGALNAINSNLGGVEDFGNRITDDLATLAADQAQSRADAIQLSNAQANENAVAAAGSQVLANDQLGLSSDQSGASSVSMEFQIQIAELRKQLAGDNIELQKLQAKGNQTSQEMLDELKQANDNAATMIGQAEMMLDGLMAEDISNLDPRAIARNLAAQNAMNKTASS